MQETNSNTLLLIIVTGSAILLSLLLFLYSILKLNLRKKSEYFETIELLRVNSEKQILETAVEVEEETFAIIAREIHDNINQSLTLVKLVLSTCTFQDEASTSKIKTAKELITTAITDLSHMSKNLNSDVIKSMGFLKFLNGEIERLNFIGSVHVELIVEDFAIDLNPEVELILYRIFQEAVRNAIMHGKAKRMIVTIKEENGVILFQIEDNGCGFNMGDLAARTGQGLKNIQKRLNLIKGIFEINSVVNQGTVLTIRVGSLHEFNQ
ncbi:sensor histidine kinase [Flavihumibacter solisilvae]|uniref:Histidine kinase domain-containing protein n=1 Tax=Flavihumibacter solisilvae TaxID=1349421 RepID=A0A0C1KW91_9BACT|nr:ATP-binding protein [Flavihumibacter solisilvae]KIC91987.1 hypothetical protein OI18_22175 [Flavihumibacter solisilvae]